MSASQTVRLGIDRGAGVQGELMKWAREQQEFTMRDVHLRGGPSPAHQSEHESGAKASASPTTVARWAAALSVSEEFAYGLVPRCAASPDRTRGLAADVAYLIY